MSSLLAKGEAEVGDKPHRATCSLCVSDESHAPSARPPSHQSTKLHKENARLKSEAYECNKFLHALLAQRKGHDPHLDDCSQTPYPSPSLSSNQSQPLASPIPPSHVSQSAATRLHVRHSSKAILPSTHSCSVNPQANVYYHQGPLHSLYRRYPEREESHDLS